MGDQATARRADFHRELGDRLRAAGYRDDELGDLLGAPSARAVDPEYLPLSRRRTRAGREPLAALAELFLVGAEVEEERAARALAPLTVEQLVDAGLADRVDGAVRARLRVLPYEDLLLASDPAGLEAGAEEVSAPGPSARTLASLTVRRHVNSALDLGTGGGVQGLLLARHAEHAVLTDVSERALQMAALNAQLNGIENIELRRGDWLEPVAGECFDLVAANLPYVVSPDVTYVHRDNPLERDALSRSIVERIGDYLTDGGFAHVLCNWVHGASEEWASAPLEWVAGTGCDALVLHYASHEPLEYAASWNRPLQQGDPAAFEATLDRWLAYYGEAGIERIASGAVILRRRSGRTWARPVEVPEAPTGLAGDHLERLFAAQDELAALGGPEALLGERFRPSPGQRLEQTMAYGDGGWAPGAALMRRHPGIGVVTRVDPRVMPVVVGCDGKRRLGQLIGQTTDHLGPQRVEVATLCFATVRTAFELGLLERT